MTTRHPYDCHVRFTESEYRALCEMAERESRSLTAQVRFMLSKLLQHESAKESRS